MTDCEMCGGRGVVEVADIYTDLNTGEKRVVWELSHQTRCGCWYRQEAS